MRVHSFVFFLSLDGCCVRHAFDETLLVLKYEECRLPKGHPKLPCHAGLLKTSKCERYERIRNYLCKALCKIEYSFTRHGLSITVQVPVRLCSRKHMLSRRVAFRKHVDCGSPKWFASSFYRLKKQRPSRIRVHSNMCLCFGVRTKSCKLRLRHFRSFAKTCRCCDL